MVFWHVLCEDSDLERNVSAQVVSNEPLKLLKHTVAAEIFLNVAQLLLEHGFARVSLTVEV
jgi:hypothetical protein